MSCDGTQTSFVPISRERFDAGMHCADGVNGRVDLESLLLAFCTGAHLQVTERPELPEGFERCALAAWLKDAAKGFSPRIASKFERAAELLTDGK